MQLESAMALRDQYQHLVEQGAKDLDANIYDVIVVPVDGFEIFLTQYREDLKDVSNDEMIINYPSRDYAVKAVYEYDPELVDLYTGDSEDYINMYFITSEVQF